MNDPYLKLLARIEQIEITVEAMRKDIEKLTEDLENLSDRVWYPEGRDE